jgi:DNA repair exonuclease SbcCD ATPase subunit
MTPAEGTTSAVLQRIEANQQRLEQKLDALNAAFQGFQVIYEQRHSKLAEGIAIMTQRIEHIEKIQSEHDRQIEALVKSVQHLEDTVKILSAVGGTAFSAILLWLIGQLLGLL